MLHTGVGRRNVQNRGGAGVVPIFSLPLADLGAGVVRTTPLISMGSPTATFTRATVAWTKLSSGLWAQVASGTARSCYIGANTVASAYGGYFSEPAATQLVTPDASIRDMTDAAWTATNVTVAKDATGIDGVANSASTLTCTSNGGTVLQTLTAAASSRTYSAWVRRKTGTGTITIQQTATTEDITAQINSTTYTRVDLTASILNVVFGFIMGTSGDAIEVDFNQFEAGAFATSPMATAGAARNLDVLVYSVIGNISGIAGSAYAEYAGESVTTTDKQIVGFTVAGGFPLAAVGDNTNLAAQLFDGTNNPITTKVLAIQTIGKIASSWGGSSSASFLNGLIATSGYNGTLGSGAGALSIGQGGSTGIQKNVRIYNRALSAAQLQAMTT